MGLLRDMKEARFWKTWKDRFEDERSLFITPNNPSVSQAADRASRRGLSRKETAMDVWEYIYDNVDYILSKRWKTPAETLRERTGDCEDVTFLAASMLVSLGIDDFTIEIGELIYPDGRVELHTWVEVDDLVVDPTGSPRKNPVLKYRSVQSYRINAS